MRNLGGFFMSAFWWRFVLEAYQKPALTFEEQLDQLKERGLIVNDQALALSQLSTISYYRLSAYWYPFKARGKHGRITSSLVAGTSFDDIVSLYEFDRHLRLLVMDAIERVEVYVRTLITYYIGHTYGAFGHTDPTHFHPKFGHAHWLSKLEEEAARSSDVFVDHYRNKYEGFPTLPIWMITEVMSLGSLSFCYKGLKNDDKRAISSELDLPHKRLGDWLHKLTYIRNVCAHHSRLWNRELSIRPESVRDEIWNPPVTPRKDRVFYILLMLRYLLKAMNNGDSWYEECNQLIEPIAVEKRWRLAMGLPENWKSHPIWI
jgi:abortive infection bacteriophage resistance protein